MDMSFQVLRYFLNVLLLFLCSGAVSAQKDTLVRVVGFESSECLNEKYLSRVNNRIVAIEQKEDTVFVTISVVANCCIGSVPTVNVLGDTIQLGVHVKSKNVIKNENDSVFEYYQTVSCDCKCCFNFKYVIKGIRDLDKVFRFNTKILWPSDDHYRRIREPLYTIQNGDTVNFIDAYGFRYGKFTSVDSSRKEIVEVFYCGQEACSGLFRRTRNLEGKLKFECYILSEDSYKMVYYYPDGSVKAICFGEYFLFPENCSYFSPGNYYLKNIK